MQEKGNEARLDARKGVKIASDTKKGCEKDAE